MWKVFNHCKCCSVTEQNPITKDMLLKDLSPSKIKTIVSDFFLKPY